VGLGKVGSALAGRLTAAGASVMACDIDDARAERQAVELGLELAPSAEAIMGMELDVLCPCAAGGLIDDALARSIECSVVAGAANNPLSGRGVAATLAKRGILYVPDFLANCGGLIHVADEWYGKSGRAPGERQSIERAMEHLDSAIESAKQRDLTPHEVAERQALERVELARAA
jgi:leucine dehydrogenase